MYFTLCLMAGLSGLAFFISCSFQISVKQLHPFRHQLLFCAHAANSIFDKRFLCTCQATIKTLKSPYTCQPLTNASRCSFLHSVRVVCPKSIIRVIVQLSIMQSGCCMKINLCSCFVSITNFAKVNDANRSNEKVCVFHCFCWCKYTVI